MASAFVINSDNNVLRVTEGTAGAFDVTLTSGTYYLAEPDGAGADQFCEMLRGVLDARSTAVGDGNQYTVTFTGNVGSVTGVLTIESDGTSIQINGGHANTTFDTAWVGFPAADSAAATSINSTLSPIMTWCSNQPAELIYPSHLDGGSVQHRTQEGQRHTFRTADAVTHRRLAFSFIEPERTWAPSADSGKGFDTFWRQISSGRPIKLYKEGLSAGTSITQTGAADLVGTYVLASPLDRWEPTADTRLPTFAWDLDLATYVS